MNDPTLHYSDESLNEYLDGALEPALRGRLEAHLANCADCTRRLDGLRVLFGALDSLPEEMPSHDLAPAILQSVQRMQDTRFQRGVLLLGVALQAVAALLVLFIWPPTALWQQLAQSTSGLLKQVDFSQLALNLTSLQQSWQSPFAGLIQNLQQAQVPLTQSWSASVPFSALEIGLFGLAAFLLWLAGNSLLIRTIHPHTQRR
jgi:hypothetical protein